MMIEVNTSSTVQVKQRFRNTICKYVAYRYKFAVELGNVK